MNLNFEILIGEWNFKFCRPSSIFLFYFIFFTEYGLCKLTDCLTIYYKIRRPMVGRNNILFTFMAILGLFQPFFRDPLPHTFFRTPPPPIFFLVFSGTVSQVLGMDLSESFSRHAKNGTRNATQQGGGGCLDPL